MPKKYKEYSFSATQIMKSQAMVYIVATNIKEAREMLKKVKPHTIDWYPNNIDDSLLNTYIGNIRYYPIMTESEINDELIYHPVKDSKSDREKSIVSLDKRR